MPRSDQSEVGFAPLLRRLGRQPREPADAAIGRLGRLEARRLMDRYAGRVAPALAAGLVGLGDVGDPALAALLGIVTYVTAARLRRVPLPLHMMPISRTALAIAAPVAGAASVALLIAYTGRLIPVGALVSAVVAAWLVAALGAWVHARFEAARPVRIAVIGEERIAALLARDLGLRGVPGHVVVGTILPAGASRAQPGEPPVIGSVSELDKVVETGGVDLLVNAVPGSRLEVIERVATHLERGISMIELDQLYERLFGHVPIAAINSAWFRYMMHPDYHRGGWPAKRAFDLLAATVAAVLCAPLLAVSAIAIGLFEGRPVLYRQRRVGEGGREFSILKLRTMQPDAQPGEERWSAKGDRRVTRIGRWLRSTHVDELPQLWNVIRGEMTLVGPRPEQPGIVGRLERSIPYYERRHLAKPGITGWAQARCGYAGSETGTAWKVCHDLFYLKRRSVLVDALVALETLGAVGYGAQYGREVPDHSLVLGQAPAG